MHGNSNIKFIIYIVFLCDVHHNVTQMIHQVVVF